MKEIRPQSHQLNKVTKFPKLKTKKDVQLFMGCINVLCNWTSKNSTSFPTLRKLMDADTNFKWSDTAEEFKKLKEIAGNLDFPSPYDNSINEIHINTDTSKEGIGYVVYQIRGDGKRNVIQMGSSALKNHQKRWSINKLEALAMTYPA